MKKRFFVVCLPLLMFADAMHDPAIAIINPTVSIVSSGGETVTMMDGTIYMIDPKDQKYASAWIANSSEVIVGDDPTNADYPVTLTNKSTGTTVHAKLEPSSEDQSSITNEAPSESDGED